MPYERKTIDILISDELRNILNEIKSDSVVAEERRLFYVGMTRAKVDLHISYRGLPSRFLRESGLLTRSYSG